MYEERKLVPANPFVTIDVDGVGRLMRIASRRGSRGERVAAPRDLRRARRRPGERRVLPRDRARLRELLAVPGGDGAAGGRSGGGGRLRVRLEVGHAALRLERPRRLGGPARGDVRDEPRRRGRRADRHRQFRAGVQADEAAEAKLARTRWLERNDAESSFPCGVVPEPEPPAGDSATERGADAPSADRSR